VAFGEAVAQANSSQKGRWGSFDPPAVTLDKISKALMLGQQFLSFIETHSLQAFYPSTPRRVADLQAAALQYRDVVKGGGKGRRAGNGRS
jgi:hypothetical protein